MRNVGLLLFLIVSWPRVIVGDSFDHWTWLNPRPPSFVDITASESRFVGVTAGHPISSFFTSSDGANWKQEPVGISKAAYSIAYGRGVFVVLAGDATHSSVMVSSNLTSWQEKAFLTNGLDRVRFVNGLFIALGEGMATSTNGVNWVPHPKLVSGFLRDVTYGQGKWLAVGGFSPEGGIAPNMTVVASTDGETWTVLANSTGNPLYGVAFGNDQFVAVGTLDQPWWFVPHGVIMVSTNGSAWTQKLTTDDWQELRSVTRVNGSFFASALPTPGKTIRPTLVSSPDGITWVNEQIISNKPLESLGTFTTMQGITISAGEQLLVAQGGGIWKEVTQGLLDGQINDVIIGDSGWVAATSSGIFFSPTGTDWTTNLFPAPFPTQAPVYFHGTYAATSIAQLVVVSKDGRSWSSSIGGFEVAVVNDQLVASYEGEFSTLFKPGLATSTDGINWRRHPNTFAHPGSLVYGNGVYLMARDPRAGRDYHTSTDLDHWSAIDSALSGKALFGDGRFYLFSASESHRSEDGRTWVKWGPVPDSEMPRQLSFEDGRFYWLSARGLFTSRDALAWDKVSTPVNLVGFSFHEGRMLAYGGGSIVLSDPIPRLETVLTNCDTAAFLAALNNTQIVRFECDGTVQLTNTAIISHETTINASGRNITIDGGGRTSLFEIVSTNATLKLDHLTLANGFKRVASTAGDPSSLESLGGAAILNSAGQLIAQDCTFLGNLTETLDAVAPALGGDICNLRGDVQIRNCIFIDSIARSRNSRARGGSIYSSDGHLTIKESFFEHCQAIYSGPDQAGGRSVGGAIVVASGPCELFNVMFTNTLCSGSAAAGAVLHNSGTLQMKGCLFQGNGAADLQMQGAGIFNAGQLTATECYFANHLAITPSSIIEPQSGGAIHSKGGANFSRCTFENNLATGQSNAGGAIYSSADLSCTNCTFYQNKTSNGEGGAIFIANGAGTISFCTLSENGGTLRKGNAVGTSTGGQLKIGSSILSSSTAATVAANANIVDLGYNVVSDSPGAFQSSTSRSGTDPLLKDYGWHGGVTPTIPLRFGSWAIDHGSPADFPGIDQRGELRPLGSAPDVGAYETLGFTVADLQTAVASGGTIVLDFDGQLAVTNTLNIVRNTRIEAPWGRAVTLSGGGSTRLFRVSTNVVLELSNITLRDAYGNGGGILNEGGKVRLDNCLFVNNSTSSPPFPLPGGPGAGADIYNIGGILLIKDCLFTNSITQAGFSAYAPAAQGGSIYTDQGWVEIRNARFQGCRLIPGYGIGFGGPAVNGICSGGAICSLHGDLILDHVEFLDNSGTTKVPGIWGDGTGGAIYNGGALRATGCTFSHNGAAGLTLGAAICNTGDMSVMNSYFFENTLVRPADSDLSGIGYGAQYGGAVYSTTPANFSGCTFASNAAVGSGTGYHNLPTVPPAAPGLGAAIFAEADLTLMNCTFYQNRVAGGNVVTPAPGYGGAVFVNHGRLQAKFCTFMDNTATIGPADGTTADPGFGSAIGTSTNAIAELAFNIFADSNAKQDLNLFYGVIRDLGFNICNEPSPELTASSSLHNTDPRLGTIGFYGGMAPTFPLMPGSPAIDFVLASSSPPLDARGVARPQGIAADAGAFEYTENKLLLLDGPQGVTLSFSNASGRPVAFEESADLKSWGSLSSSNAITTEPFSFQLNKAGGRRFFRVR